MDFVMDNPMTMIYIKWTILGGTSMTWETTK